MSKNTELEKIISRKGFDRHHVQRALDKVNNPKPDLQDQLDALEYLENIYNNTDKTKVQTKRFGLFPGTVTRVDPIQFLNTLMEDIMQYQSEIQEMRNLGLPFIPEKPMDYTGRIQNRYLRLAALLYGKYIQDVKRNKIILTIFRQPSGIATRSRYSKYMKAIDEGIKLIKEQWDKYTSPSQEQNTLLDNNTENQLRMLRIAKGYEGVDGVNIVSPEIYKSLLSHLETNINENQIQIIETYNSQNAIVNLLNSPNFSQRGGKRKHKKTKKRKLRKHRTTKNKSRRKKRTTRKRKRRSKRR